MNIKLANFPKALPGHRRRAGTKSKVMMRVKTYQYYNNILCIPASLLYDDWELMSYRKYLYKCEKGQLVRVREGKGKGNEALLDFYRLPEEYKDACKENLGDPKKVVTINLLEEWIVPDSRAITFFADHTYPDGTSLKPRVQVERATNCCILNAIRSVLESPKYASATFGPNKTRRWEEISKAVNTLDRERWTHNLPKAPSRLKQRYQRYLKEGYRSFIHAGEGNQHTRVIKGEIADYLMAVYCLPNAFSIPELHHMYLSETDQRGWPSLSEGAIKMFLDRPENRRVWTLARHGKEVYDKKYKHTVSRDRTRWFPNVYWAIDGTKLDLVYYDPDSSNKMASYKRVDVVFDVHSQKIIGWSFSETENHTDHFRSMKMAIQNSGCRPYLLTYDNQSGHRMAGMQDFYSRIVAEDGGTHYLHRAYGHGNPADELFGLFQKEVIIKLWNSDGQGVRTRKDDSRRDVDFLMSQRENLPTKESIIRYWEAAVRTWNEGRHSTKLIARNTVYQEAMPMREELKLEEIVKYMWIEEKKRTITYRAHGIEVEVSGRKHLFEVYDDEGRIDLEFRRKHIGSKFIVRYDPDNMDSYIQLLGQNHAGEKYLVAYALPKRAYDPVPATMLEGEKARWLEDFAVRDREYERDMKAIEALQKRTGITPERMIAEQEMAIKMQGIVKKSVSIETDKKKSLLTQI